ncbi:MAG TPA: rRNA maturation RNase YbeY, partial [Candidatus Binataceae bacterium]|nr:rRNA maturation RNase YbeY [Candidatus Binataceae bacterium]
ALAADARALLRAAGHSEYELSVLIVNDAAIRALNRDYRHKDRATDVLSFPLFEMPSRARLRERRQAASPDVRRGSGAGEAMLGDVVISIETALGQAHELNLSPRERLRQLLAHGLTHLLGYDHERSRAAARQQFAVERELLATLATARTPRIARLSR